MTSSDLDPPSRMGGGFGRVVGSGIARSFIGVTGDSAVFGAAATGARRDRIENSSRFARGTFRNTKSHDELKALRTAPMSSTLAEYFKNVARAPQYPLPMDPDTLQRLQERDDDGLRLTWLGHSTVLIEIDGVRVLTDPVFGERVSPSSLVGPKRFHETPLPLSAIDERLVDVITVSHDHYDHLDYPTMKHIATTTLPIVCPLGVGAHLERWGIAPARITELDWWDEHVVTTTRGTSLRIVSAPAQHFSGRRMDDENTTLWTSFAYIGDKHRVFFSGDSGITDEFAEIGDRLGGKNGFDVTMVETGAWHPAWGDIHLGPKNALAVHKMLRGQHLLPVHWGTFNLALHAWDEPIETLLGLAAQDDTRVLTPILGRPFSPAKMTTPTTWWRR